jgi:hypothetical protein
MTWWQIQQIKKQMKQNGKKIKIIKKKADQYHKNEEKDIQDLEKQLEEIYQ